MNLKISLGKQSWKMSSGKIFLWVLLEPVSMGICHKPINSLASMRETKWVFSMFDGNAGEWIIFFFFFFSLSLRNFHLYSKNKHGFLYNFQKWHHCSKSCWDYWTHSLCCFCYSYNVLAIQFYSLLHLYNMDCGTGEGCTTKEI